MKMLINNSSKRLTVQSVRTTNSSQLIGKSTPKPDSKVLLGAKTCGLKIGWRLKKWPGSRSLGRSSMLIRLLFMKRISTIVTISITRSDLMQLISLSFGNVYRSASLITKFKRPKKSNHITTILNTNKAWKPSPKRTS